MKSFCRPGSSNTKSEPGWKDYLLIDSVRNSADRRNHATFQSKKYNPTRVLLSEASSGGGLWDGSGSGDQLRGCYEGPGWGKGAVGGGENNIDQSCHHAQFQEKLSMSTFIPRITDDCRSNSFQHLPLSCPHGRPSQAWYPGTYLPIGKNIHQVSPPGLPESWRPHLNPTVLRPQWEDLMRCRDRGECGDKGSCFLVALCPACPLIPLLAFLSTACFWSFL